MASTRGQKRSRREKVAILGFHDGNAGQVETWFEEASGLEIAAFVLEAETPPQIDPIKEKGRRVSQRVEFPSKGSFKGRPFIVDPNWAELLLKRGIRKVLPLTPENRDRVRQIRRCGEAGLEVVSAIHPSALILSGATIAPGAWINAGAIIGYKCELAEGVIVNTGAQLDHHNVARAGSQVGPGVVTAGNVTFDECCQVYSGVVIINRKIIGQDAIVGAGAVVIDDIPPGCTAVGVPARVIRRPDGTRVPGPPAGT